MKSFNCIIHCNPEESGVDHGITSSLDVLELLPYLVVFMSSFLGNGSKVREEVNLRSILSDVCESSSHIYHPLPVTEIVKPHYHCTCKS